MHTTGTLPPPLDAATGPRQNLLHALDCLDASPYSIQLYLECAALYARLAYPDLAAGAAYKALLLADAVEDDCDEYHERTLRDLARGCVQLPDDLRTGWPAWGDEHVAQLAALDLDAEASDGAEDEALPDRVVESLTQWVGETLVPIIHLRLAQHLLECNCLRSAHRHAALGLSRAAEDVDLQAIKETILTTVRTQGHDVADLESWPDSGLVRRECYPWNTLEPDRFSAASLAFLNAEMAKCAPDLEVRAVELPALHGGAPAAKTIKQLGVFARRDMGPDELVLDETSLLTANNRLQDALCDACGADLAAAAARGVLCDDCATPFCGEACLDAAMEAYHPAVCDKGVDAIARDVPPAQAADSLYLLLLLRAVAMAETRGVHPLALDEVRFIWGDYQDGLRAEGTLPFGYDANVVLPLHMLTVMDVDVFAAHRSYDVWVFNTLYAKFRGTASARLAGPERGAGKGNAAGVRLVRSRGPEVSAVHPCWCLANHSCDPNVRWEWGGKVQFRTRDERQTWRRPGGARRTPNRPGLRKGEEVLGHYCDVDMAVADRRGWAAGALGGDCRCERCTWEAGEVDADDEA